MKRNWFKRCGWFHYPASIPGILILLAAIAFCVQVFRAVDRHSHSVSDTLFGVFPYFTCCFLLCEWVAGRSSDESDPA